MSLDQQIKTLFYSREIKILAIPKMLDFMGMAERGGFLGEGEQKFRRRLEGCLPECHPFIFSELLKTEVVDEDGCHDFPSLPFRVCSFEVQGTQALYNTRKDGRLAKAIISILEEVRPGTLMEHAIYGVVDQDGFDQFAISSERIPSTSFPIVNKILGSMRRSSLGVQKTNIQFRTGSGSAREKHRIREVIHVAPKSKRVEYSLLQGLSIDWSHRWEVMGHWRKTAGIGKNREGSYEVNGMTWVVPHTKGPEHKELIIKKRVVL